MIPKHMVAPIELWVQHGAPHPSTMGAFLRAVLTNDLMGAATWADDENARALREWARYLYNEVPALAHGSMERLEAWHARGGLVGRAA